jgi:hypothetical protein
MDSFTLAALTSAMHSFNSKTVMSWSFAATSDSGTSVMYDAVLRVLYSFLHFTQMITMARTNKNDTETKGEMDLLLNIKKNKQTKQNKTKKNKTKTKNVCYEKSLTYTCTCKILSDIY